MTEEAKKSPITGIPRWKVTGSSNIEEAGHDEISGVIEIKFRTGAVWQYGHQHGFDRHTFEAFREAESAGKFFREHIYSRENPQRHVEVTQNESADPRRRGDDGQERSFS